MKISLTESELKYLIKETVKAVLLNEMSKPLDRSEFIKRAKAKHGERYDYSKVHYVDRKTPVKIICPKHGEFEQRPKNHLRGRGCSQCRIPRLERVVSIILKELHVNYTEHFRKEWLDKQHLDFYIEEFKTGIECQGIQHYKVVDFFGGKVRYLNQCKNDIIKQIKCITNGVELETISYEDSDAIIRQKVTNLINRLKSEKENTED